MADVQFPIIEGEPPWSTSVDPLDPFHFQDSLAAAGYHTDWSGDIVPTYRGNPAQIDLSQVASTFAATPAPQSPATIPVAPAAPVAPVVSPVANQANLSQSSATIGPSTSSTWLVLGIAALVVVAIVS
jgi:hypothetical protein